MASSNGRGATAWAWDEALSGVVASRVLPGVGNGTPAPPRLFLADEGRAREPDLVGRPVTVLPR
jgi:hypothetical protein